MQATNKGRVETATRRRPRKVGGETRRAARLARFAAPFDELIAGLTAAAPQAEDLAETFPALLFALVSGYGCAKQREQAFATILAGGSLKTAAEQLALPFWLRRLPAEAFAVPLPALPQDPQFAVRIANHIPEATHGAREWLEDVAFASAVSDQSFALWVARQCHAVPASRRGLVFLMIGAWHWYGRQPGTLGHRLIEQTWSPKMGLRRAREEMIRWRRRADLACLIGEGIESSWLTPGRVRGYDFVALMTLDDFLEESREMHNCLDQYADRLGSGLVRVFSIRRKGRRIANVEVGPMSRDRRRPAIVQLKATRNRRTSAAVRAAVEDWFDTQALSRLSWRPGPVRSEPAEAQRAAFWAPFLAALPEGQRDVLEGMVLPRKSKAHGRPGPRTSNGRRDDR